MILNLLLLLIIVGGGVFLILGEGTPTPKHPAVRKLPHELHKLGDPEYFTAAPKPTYTRSDDGVVIARLDTQRLTEWCRSYGLPDPPFLPETEPIVADTLVEALDEVVKNPGAGSFGRLGMIFESLDCHESAARHFRYAAMCDEADYRWPYYLGCIHQIMGANDEAVAKFRTVLQLNESYAMTHGRLAQLYLEGGQAGLARERLERYIQLKPQDSFGYVGLARLAMVRQDYAAALQHARQGYEYGSNYFQVHFYLAKAYAGLGQDDLAKKHFDICAKLPQGLWFALRDPLDQELHASIDAVSVLEKQLEQLKSSRDWARLAEMAEQIILRRPGDTLMMTNLAGFYRKLKRFAEAHELLDRAEELDPELLLLRLTRAELFLAESKFDEAIATADEALLRDNRAARAYNVRGRALFVLQRFGEAAESMRECVRLEPDNAANVFILAESLLADGLFEEAAANYRHVQSLVPGHERAASRLVELEKLLDD